MYQHHPPGWNSSIRRILGKTTKPYTSERIYAALCTDPADKSNNNQVGDYTTRQKKVIEMIRTYAVEEGTKVNLWNKTQKLLDDQVGYLEGAMQILTVRLEMQDMATTQSIPGM